MQRVHADDTVVTPTNRRALVLRRKDNGRCDLKYLDNGDLGTAHEQLLRVVKPGCALPAPVRVVTA